MVPIDFAAIEQSAKQMRAEEMLKIGSVIADRTGLFFRLTANSLGVLVGFASEALRPLFSWNPQQHRHH